MKPMYQNVLLFLLALLGGHFWENRSRAMRPPDEHSDNRATRRTYGKRDLFLEGNPISPLWRYNVPSMVTFERAQESHEEINRETSISSEKLRLAAAMKARYREFRKNLEKSSTDHQQGTTITPPLRGHPLPHSRGKSHGARSPTTFQDSEVSLEVAKQLRSADEAGSPLRSSGIRPEAHPFPKSAWSNKLGKSNATQKLITEESTDHGVLEERLGPLARPSFDPSIVLDFSKLLQLTRQSQELRKSGIPLGRDPQNPKTGLKPTIILKSAVETSEEDRLVRRRLPGGTNNHVADGDNSVRHQLTKDTEQAQKTFSKRDRYLHRPYSVLLSQENTTGSDENLSLYVSSTEPQTAEQPLLPKQNTDSEFGLFSDGNDANAGISPSEVTIPELDLTQLPLPQGVRDSLRKYLKPLISALKPLRKSVPGLPGLDYPILSVVPYTNFYCSNMPWPGFYADTEARCQTWHACDVDGRQATFLCPNGTVFNQALMVCDWWYNTDCLASPFLYPLNERLFGDHQPAPVTPYNRITPQLLDSIFV